MASRIVIIDLNLERKTQCKKKKMEPCLNFHGAFITVLLNCKETLYTLTLIHVLSNSVRKIVSIGLFYVRQ